MAISNHERVGKAMDLLKSGLTPFIEREFRGIYKDQAQKQAAFFLGEDQRNARKPIADWDAAAALKVFWDAWNEIFRKILGPAENYGGRVSFRYCVPLAVGVAVVFTLLWVNDRRKGGYRVERVGAGAH